MALTRSSGSARRRLPRWAVISIVLGGVLAFGVVSTVAGTWLVADRYDRQIQRQNLLDGVTKPVQDASTDPAEAVDGPMTILMVGSDTRATGGADVSDPSGSAASVPGQRADTIMMVRLSAGLDRAWVVSIPRDSYVEIPAVPGVWEGGKSKINSAYEYGGVPTLAQAVTDLTGIGIDHAVVVDFAGFASIVDALGGIEVTVPKTITSIHTGRVFPQGGNTLDGKQTLDLVRQRYQYADGDFSRIKVQQSVLTAMLAKMTSTGVLADPRRLDATVGAVASALTVDSAFPVKGLAFALRDLAPSDIRFATIPTLRADLMTQAGMSVEVDVAAVREMFSAVEADGLDGYLVEHPQTTAVG